MTAPDADRLADAGRRDIRPHVLHGVVDREHRARVAALAVDVELDVAVLAVGVEVQQLRDERVRDARVDRGAEVDDALGEQVRVDVHDAIASRMLRHDVRDRVAAHAATSAADSTRARRGRRAGGAAARPARSPTRCRR